jgi:hypothetical protein
LFSFFPSLNTKNAISSNALILGVAYAQIHQIHVPGKHQ